MGVAASAEASAFRDALHKGQTKVVEEAVHKNSKLAKVHIEQDGGTAWHVAAHEGKLELLQALHDATVSHEMSKPKCKKDASLVAKAVKHVVNKRNVLGQTPLMVACMKGRGDCVAWLLTKGADPWAKTGETLGELSALHYAVKAGSKECVVALLSFVKADPKLNLPRQGCRYVDIKSWSAFSPLHYAAWYNRKEMVSILSGYGAILTCQSWYSQCEELHVRQGSTPLHVAAKQGHGSFIRELLTAYVARVPIRTPAEDLRLIRDSHHDFPFNVAMQNHHYNVVTWLHPMTPLQDIADRSDPNRRVLGPPTLVQIVGPVAQKVLLGSIDMLDHEIQQHKSSRAAQIAEAEAAITKSSADVVSKPPGISPAAAATAPAAATATAAGVQQTQASSSAASLLSSATGSASPFATAQTGSMSAATAATAAAAGQATSTSSSKAVPGAPTAAGVPPALAGLPSPFAVRDVATEHAGIQNRDLPAAPLPPAAMAAMPSSVSHIASPRAGHATASQQTTSSSDQRTAFHRAGSMRGLQRLASRHSMTGGNNGVQEALRNLGGAESANLIATAMDMARLQRLASGVRQPSVASAAPLSLKPGRAPPPPPSSGRPVAISPRPTSTGGPPPSSRLSLAGGGLPSCRVSASGCASTRSHATLRVSFSGLNLLQQTEDRDTMGDSSGGAEFMPPPVSTPLPTCGGGTPLKTRLDSTAVQGSGTASAMPLARTSSTKGEGASVSSTEALPAGAPLVLARSSTPQLTDAELAVPVDVLAASSAPASPALPALLGNEQMKVLPPFPAHQFKLRGSLARRTMPVFNNFDPSLASQQEELGASQGLAGTREDSGSGRSAVGPKAFAVHGAVSTSQVADAPQMQAALTRPASSPSFCQPRASFSLTGALLPNNELPHLSIEPLTAASADASWCIGLDSDPRVDSHLALQLEGNSQAACLQLTAGTACTSAPSATSGVSAPHAPSLGHRSTSTLTQGGPTISHLSPSSSLTVRAGSTGLLRAPSCGFLRQPSMGLNRAISIGLQRVPSHTHQLSLGLTGAGAAPDDSDFEPLLGDEGSWHPPAAAEHQASVLSMVETFREASMHVMAGRRCAAADCAEGSGAADAKQSTKADTGTAVQATAADMHGLPTPQQDERALKALEVLTSAAAQILERRVSVNVSCNSCSNVIGKVDAHGAEDDEFDNMCGVCMDDDPDFVVVQPCMHKMCLSCTRELVKIHQFKPSLCPFCRRVILGFDLP